jgi:membrane-bound serine protease (ClpP class)
MTAIVVLLLVGGVLLFLETLLPGLVAGIVGLGCLLTAVVLAYRTEVVLGHWVLAVVVAGLGLGTWAWLKFFPESRIAQKFVSHQAVGDLGVEQREFLHAEGEALTRLRPSGVARLQGQRVDVVTEGGMIERGARVKVVAVEGARVVVRAF